MKIKELSKDELVKLLTLLCERNKNQYMFIHVVNGFLQKKWNDMLDKLFDENEKCDITTIKGYEKWREINKKIDEMQSSKAVKYHLTLDELE